MSQFVPSRSRETSPDMFDCEACDQTPGSDTPSLLRSDIKHFLEETTDERRKHLRVQKKFRVAYSTPKESIETYLFNIGLGGVFVETNHPSTPGEVISLRVFLPSGEKELGVMGEVVWCTKETWVTPEKTYPPGMGVRFLNLTAEDRIRLNITLLEDN